ncbi:SCO2523 family variant P-loop protein [Actinoplanes sp. NPDC020271]|uniref:SCO2523 family variant P-loop protein n=1 Tax=Actinoplanes sp. NPDC020271 TaxID=3363896 RepID=UPI0037888650
MFVFAASDKGGTGRSVTSCNLLYRSALQGNDVCYVDFDFGSPTAGAIFGIERAETGTDSGSGLHRYLLHHVPSPERIDVWTDTDSKAVRDRPDSAGRLVLLPGDLGGSDFQNRSEDLTAQCLDLFLQLKSEFKLCIVDLSAGRNLAVETALKVTAMPQMQNVQSRWLVFHRWTRQHVMAAGGLVNGPRGLLGSAKEYGHDPEQFRANLRYVRTAVIDPASSTQRGLTAAQGSWLRQCNTRLAGLAGESQVGKNLLLGSIPLDPVLQWQEQLITDSDVAKGIANEETRNAFNALAERLVDDAAWGIL